MNKVALVGRLTTKPSIENETRTTKFTVALRRRFTNNNNIADFVHCVAKNHNAEFIAEHFDKGDTISIIGELRTTKRERDGKPYYSTSVLVEEVSYIKQQQEQQE